LKRALVLAIACLILLPAIALSQTRRRTASGRGTRSSSSSSTTAANSASEIRAGGATRVADQVKVLTRFIYLLGRISTGFETADDLARRNEASPSAIQQTERSKAEVKGTLRNVREGLDNLEIYFRTTPELQRYYTRLAGVAAGAANAEDQAAANQFDRAGRSLLEVVNRLTDVLLEMR
jgi:hypothetical protein